MAKKKRTDEAVKDKDAIAKERVDELLKDVPLTLTKTKPQEEATDALEVLDKNKSNAWLESQLNALTERNEALEAELEQAKNDFKRLGADFIEYKKKAGLPPSDSELQAKIIALFRKFEKAYNGNNAEQVRYTTIKLSNPPNNNGVLDEFIKSFGDMLKGK